MTTILTCYSSLAHDGNAPSACPTTTGRKRRKRSVIDEKPLTDSRNEIGNYDIGNDVNEEDLNHDDVARLINPSRTVLKTVPMMTMKNVMDVVEDDNKVDASFSIDLEVIRNKRLGTKSQVLGIICMSLDTLYVIFLYNFL